MMPGMDGYQVCKVIKENPATSRTHVIILSAKGEIKDKISGIEYGADDYITKPFDPMELEARINLNIRHPVIASSTHPLTKLPTENELKEHLTELIAEKKDFHMYSFNLNGLEKIAKNKGYKKLNDLLVLFARLVHNNLQSHEFLGHTFNNSFVVVGNQSKVSEDINREFGKMLPYFGVQDRSALKLEVASLSSSDIKTGNLGLVQIFDTLRIR